MESQKITLKGVEFTIHYEVDEGSEGDNTTPPESKDVTILDITKGADSFYELLFFDYQEDIEMALRLG